MIISSTYLSRWQNSQKVEKICSYNYQLTGQTVSVSMQDICENYSYFDNELISNTSQACPFNLKRWRSLVHRSSHKYLQMKSYAPAHTKLWVSISPVLQLPKFHQTWQQVICFACGFKATPEFWLIQQWGKQRLLLIQGSLSYIWKRILGFRSETWGKMA